MSASAIRRILGLYALVLFAVFSYGCALEVNVQDQRDQTDQSQEINSYEQGDQNTQGDQN